jgi:hypothetical protein
VGGTKCVDTTNRRETKRTSIGKIFPITLKQMAHRQEKNVIIEALFYYIYCQLVIGNFLISQLTSQ